MKILITYYSDTGNTEKVAEAIKEGLKGYNVELLPIKEVDSTSLLTYDLMFLGSGIYAFNINRKVTRFINKASKLPSKIVYFYTHSSPTPWPDAFNSIWNKIEQEACEIVGVFECRGEYLKEIKGKGLNDLSPRERKERELVKGHPNEQDLENAKEFALTLLKKSIFNVN